MEATANKQVRVASPAWLMLPASQGLHRPPAVTQLQVLPLHELTWENFERLCLRVAQTRGDVDGWAALYGSRGQKQSGIDVYVRRQGTGRYSCWQSKRTKLTVRRLCAAITEFEKGEWWSKSDQFCICTSAAIQDTDLQDEIETQRTRLEAKGIELHVLGQAEISLELKANSRLVRDFFGKDWIQVFCIDAAALHESSHLDADDVSRLRRELRTLYASNFSTLDPGIVVSAPGDGPNEELPLLARFVEPDVELVTSSTRLSSAAGPTVDDQQDRNVSDISRQAATPSTVQRTEDVIRIGASAWVAGGENAVISADGGLGKSTCLRAFALDLLDDGSRFPAIAKRWPDAIPILLPFAFWVRVVEEDETGASLGAVVNRWLKKFDASQSLLDLMSQCLAEGRGLLLIDGLDEWSNEAAAKSAIALLNTFVRSHSAPAIATGRPAGLARLASLDPIWRRGRLAPLSEKQQRALATAWLRHFEGGRTGASNDLSKDRSAVVKHQVGAFFQELGRTGALVGLAGTPLLLSGLISLHLRQVALPRSRFQAYEELVSLLLEVHPSRRAQAALDRGSRYKVMIHAPIRREALAHFAFEKRNNGFDAGCPVNTAVRIVSAHLESMDGAGLPRAEALSGARELVVVGVEATGLIIEKAPHEVAFVHAVFEETLAGLHLGSLPMDQQLEFVRDHAGDPRWTTSILAMMHSFSRPTDVDAIVKAIDECGVDPTKVPVQQALIAEVVFGDFRCSRRLIRNLSPSFYAAVFNDGWLPYRQRLLRNIMEAAASSRSGADVRERSAAWFPDPQNYRQSLYGALKTWPEDEALEALFLGLFNDSGFNKDAAAEQIASRFRGNPEVGNRLLTLCHTVAEAKTIAAALEAYMDGWGNRDKLTHLIASASASRDIGLRLAGVRGKIKLGAHDDDDLDFVFHLAREGSFGMGESARLFETFILGWPNDERVLQVCWEAFEEIDPERRVNRDLARAYLLAAAVSGSDIDEPLGELIEKNEHFFSLGFHGGYVRADYGPRTRQALDFRLEKTNEHLRHHVAYIALMSRSEFAKAKLIGLLGDFRWSFWPVFGLLQGWGRSDPVVSDALAEVGAWEANQLQYVAHHLPQIIQDKMTCRRRLLEITSLPELDRPDFVIAGFQRLGISSDDKEVVDALLPHATASRGTLAAVGSLILGFGSDPRVRAIAEQQMESIDGPWSEIFEAYGNDADIRPKLWPFLRALGSNLRADVISTMEGRSAEDNGFIRSLSRYSLESDANVRCAASIAYHEAISDQSDARDRALEVLGREIRAIGPQMETVRQAAFAGLVALDALEVLTALPAEERKWPIGSSAFVLKGNRRLFAYIARRWDRNSRAGSSLPDLLGIGEGERWMFWDRLAPFVRGSDACLAAFLNYCAEETNWISSSALEALAREMPGSELLKAHCFRQVEFGPSDVNASSLERRQQEFVSGRLIGLHFAADAETRRRTEAVSESFTSMKIAACSVAWKDATLLKQGFDRLAAGQHDHFVWLDAIYLASTVGDDAAFVRVLLNMINRSQGTAWDFLPLTVEPAAQRLMSSPDALDHLRRHICDQPTCSDVASIPRLMAQADGLDAKTRSWCEEVVRREMSRERMPSFGMDVSVGSTRPVVYSVLDALVPM